MPINNKHLTDTELQLHLDGQIFTTEQQAHITNCPKCAQQLQTYRQLYIGFKQLPTPTLSFDLAQAVMQKMPQKATASSSYSTQIEQIWLVATVFVLLFTLYVAMYMGVFSPITHLLYNGLTIAGWLLAISSTILLFQWIEYKFWSNKIVKWQQ